MLHNGGVFGKGGSMEDKAKPGRGGQRRSEYVHVLDGRTRIKGFSRLLLQWLRSGDHMLRGYGHQDRTASAVNPTESGSISVHRCYLVTPCENYPAFHSTFSDLEPGSVVDNKLPFPLRQCARYTLGNTSKIFMLFFTKVASFVRVI